MTFGGSEISDDVRIQGRLPRGRKRGNDGDGDGSRPYQWGVDDPAGRERFHPVPGCLLRCVGANERMKRIREG